ncbi:hypothetical protein HK405_014803, partial [Cladochytrium tenue]
TPEEFKELQKVTETRKDALESMHEACSTYVRSITNRRKDTDVTPLPIEQLATSAIELGTVLKYESEYGRNLIRFGEAHQKMAEVTREYVTAVTFGYLGEMTRMLEDLKEYARLKTKLENRRLDYDAKANKVQKSKKESSSIEEDARAAQAKYEETLSDLSSRMVAINSAEADQLQELVAFVDSELTYHQRSVELLRLLQEDLSAVPRTETTFRGNARRSQYQNSSDDTASVRSASRYAPPSGTGGAVSRSSSSSNAGAGRSSSQDGFGRSAHTPPPPLPTREPAPPPPARKQVRVVFDFDAESSEELSIRKGDIINVTVEIDEGWWEGELTDGSGRSGMFPANYTEVIERPAVAPSVASLAARIPRRPSSYVSSASNDDATAPP